MKKNKMLKVACKEMQYMEDAISYYLVAQKGFKHDPEKYKNQMDKAESKLIRAAVEGGLTVQMIEKEMLLKERKAVNTKPSGQAKDKRNQEPERDFSVFEEIKQKVDTKSAQFKNAPDCFDERTDIPAVLIVFNCKNEPKIVESLKEFYNDKATELGLHVAGYLINDPNVMTDVDYLVKGGKMDAIILGDFTNYSPDIADQIRLLTLAQQNAVTVILREAGFRPVHIVTEPGC